VRNTLGAALFVLAAVGACSDDGGLAPDSAVPDTVVAVDHRIDSAPPDAVPPDAPLPDAEQDLAPPDGLKPDAGPGTFVAVTFNTGTSENMGHDLPPDDGYTSAHAKLSDQYYGDGLAWQKAVKATKAWFAQLNPDVVVFQEIFYSGDCPNIPQTAYKDFYCETWKAGDPTVAQEVLGTGWQVMCHVGKSDKCAAVKKSFGTFRGCKTDFCLEGLEGFQVKSCGSGSRIGRGIIDLVGGGSLTLVNVHGSSGINGDDVDCRVKQFEQVFVDLGDGKPAASGARNLIMGDLNTDPGRMALFDKSAKRWNDFVGPGKKFHFISEVGPLAPPSYSGLFNIDHVVSDVGKGSCWAAGVTKGHPNVLDAVYFDHKPIVCTVSLP
jgi:hypothetical protein